MPKLFDRVKVNIATTGTGTVTFGSASSNAFLTPTEAGCADADTVRYVIVDGTDFEEGIGTIASSVSTMERTTVTKSKIGGTAGTSKINLSGSAVLAFTASAADILNTANNLSDLADASTALDNLGSTTVGKALFTATDAAAAQTAAGASTVGKTLFTATNVDTIRNVVALPNYLTGLTLSTAGNSSTFGIATGFATDSTNVSMMALASAYTKTTSAWAVGTGNGALDTGSISSSTWYHVFLIKRTDTGVVDVLISTSATAPTLPTNYTLFRRIGTMFCNSSSQWMKFSQNGDEFLWDVALNNVGSSPGTTAIQTVALSTPPGIKTTALLNVSGQGGAGSDGRGWIFSTETNSAGALSTSSTTINFGASNANQTWGTFRIRTNTSSQIKYAMLSTTGIPLITTTGWIDDRGKLG
ncbi:hypothetical protein [Nitrobacter sp.]|uniref:hypothetical protein n=1 Tax=Nitrobacter sp. TaxID=29420 RepID=UPI0025F52603|nr:hypothetical protein [Nitrobacter sp.]